MSKRDQIKATIQALRFEMGIREKLLGEQRVTLEALEAALHAEEEALQYDRYVEEQMAKVPDAHKGETEVF